MGIGAMLAFRSSVRKDRVLDFGASAAGPVAQLPRAAFALLLLAALLLVSPSKALAYGDPGTGAFVYQAVYAGFLAGTFYLRKILNRLWGKRKKITRPGSPRTARTVPQSRYRINARRVRANTGERGFQSPIQVPFRLVLFDWL
jgi:hypothetical protein